MAIAVYPGTFDPLTNGHVDVIKRAAAIFDKMIIAVSESAGKKPWLSLKERLAMCQEVFAGDDKIVVEKFDGLLVDFLQEKNANVILRGLRGASDLEFEFQLSGMNKTMYPACETVFMKASESSASISSTIVREIAGMGGDVSFFVPPAVTKRL